MTTVELHDAAATDAAIARGRRGVPEPGATVAPGDRARLLRRFAEAVDADREHLAQLEVRNSGHTIGNARWEAGNARDVIAYYSGGAGAADRPADPGRRRHRRDLPRAARRRRGDRAVELPDADRLVGVRAGAGGRQHGGAQAGRAHPADRDAAGRAGARGRHARRTCFQVLPGKGSVVGQRFVDHPDVAKIVFTGSTEVGRAGHGRLRRADQAGHAGARRQERQRRSSPTPTSTRPPRPRRTPCSTTPARTAARARGSSSSAARSTSSWRCSSRRCRASSWPTRPTRSTEMGPLISAGQREPGRVVRARRLARWRSAARRPTGRVSGTRRRF